MTNRASASGRVVVVGAGVSGLTSALELLRAGYDVTVVSKERPEQTTSAASAGVCNLVMFGSGSNDVVDWCNHSFAEFVSLANAFPESGVRLRKGHQRIRNMTTDGWWTQLPDHRLVDKTDEYASYEFSLPVADVSIYLPWLYARVKDAGGCFEWTEIQSLHDVTHEADVIVNCSGVDARDLVGDDTVEPIRGQSVQMINPEIDGFTDDDDNPDGLTLVYPRVSDVWLGASKSRSWSRTPDATETEGILQRCIALDPRVAGGDVVGVKVGLRPARPTVRVEAETSGPVPVVHNYGHGGNGVKMSWGCARSVVTLCNSLG